MDNAAKTVKYVGLEMICNKSDKYEVHSGLLKSVYGDEDDQFIAIQTTKNAMIALNLDHYNILTIEFVKEGYKHMSILTEDAVDQKSGIKLVTELYAGLLEAGMGMSEDSEVIDVVKYTDVPGTYAISSDTAQQKDSATSQTTSSIHKTQQTHAGYTPPTTTTTTTFPKVETKELVPALMTRTTSKKPTKAQIASLEEKLDMIKAGTYVAELPPTVEGTATDVDENDPYNKGIYGGGYWGGYC